MLIFYINVFCPILGSSPFIDVDRLQAHICAHLSYPNGGIGALVTFQRTLYARAACVRRAHNG